MIIGMQINMSQADTERVADLIQSYFGSHPFPIDITLNCCGDKLSIPTKEEFPKHNIHCKCGNLFIKWN